MAVDFTGIGIKVGIELLKRTTPKGIAWILQWLRGNTILIIGQPESGKSSFVNYLRYGNFVNISHERRRTRQIKKTASFTVIAGRDESLKLEVSETIDTVGQVGASEHANNTSAFKPDALLIMLDLSKPWSGSNEYHAEYYLTELFTYLADQFGRKKSLKDKIKKIVIILNKTDTSNDKEILKWKKNIKLLVKERLLNVMGPQAENIVILPCTLIETADSGKSANEIIVDLALAFSK